MIKIFRKSGWKLNTNDNIVNSILKLTEKNDGLCPCHHSDEIYEGKDLHCPCTDYTLKDTCVCKLYVRE